MSSGAEAKSGYALSFPEAAQLRTRLRDSNASSGIFPVENNASNLALRFLHSRCEGLNWFNVESSTEASPYVTSSHGVFLRNPDQKAAFWPETLETTIVNLLIGLGAKAAVMMCSDITVAVCNVLSPLQNTLNLGISGTIPVFETLPQLEEAAYRVSNVGAMIIKDQQLLIILDSSSDLLVDRGVKLEAQLLSTVWGAPIATFSATPRASVPPTESQLSATNVFNEKVPQGINTMDVTEEEKNIDLDEENLKAPKRPTVLTHSVMATIGIMIVMIICLASASLLVSEVAWDGNYLRLVLLVTLFVIIPVASFFFLVVAGSIFQVFGPLADIKSNSKKFSSQKPKRYRHRDLELPHITIQMPVYKEGLKGVIQPTVVSLLAAVKEYEREGGTASIFVNDDGLQLVPDDIAQQRLDFYLENGIGYCSRPPNGKDGFVRKGKFKKASNMNYALYTSILVEDKFAEIKEARMQELNLATEDDVTVYQEDDWYEEALNIVVEESNGKTRAGGNIRVGELVLIVDCDTRVPVDCLIYAAMEMAESPEVAIIQHASGVMQVVWNKFESGITYFTNFVYDAIEFNVGQGDVAPFVGHNAFLRWKAIQSVGFEEDGVTKFWSESHVSEDFDIALRLQADGFTIRLATYHDGGFKEGVSLTVFDELSRWEKYAYGCSELVFHPLHQWIFKGPFTPLFKKFLFSNMVITSKITLLSYIATYYALASALPLSLLNYFLYGWGQSTDWLESYYSESWKIFLPLVIVFNLASPVAYAVLRHRLGKKRFDKGLLESFRWTATFVLFFGGLSWHLMIALLSHLFCVNIEWGSTAKELTAGGYYVGVDRILKGFKFMYLFMIPFSGAMVYLSIWAPWGWQIYQPTTVIPLAVQIGCHCLMPIFLGFNLL